MINHVAFQIHGGGTGEGFAGSLASLLESLESLFGKSPPEMFAAIMPGIAALENIHPLFVHYPIALFTTFFIFDLLGFCFKKPEWRYLASWLLYLGTIAAAFTVLAGLSAADSVEHSEEVHEIMETHEHIGITVLALALFLSAWRLKQWGIQSTGANSLFIGLAGVLCLLLSLGADLGGLMVYHYGVSVNPSALASGTLGQSQNGTSGSTNDTIQENEGSPHDHEGHDHSHGGHHHHSH